MGARTSRTDAYDTKRAPERELGCFGIFSRVACQAIIAALLVAIAVLSIIALVYRGDRWAVYWQSNPQGQQTYEFHAGWNTFGSTYSAGGYHGGNDLLNFNFGCWVIGWICFAFQLACLVLAVLQFFVAVFNHSGRHTCGFGVPLGICTVAVMAAYILAFIVETREYTFRTTPPNRYTPWPGFAWITGTIAGALWVVAGSAAFCMPRKHSKALPATSSTATTPTATAAPAVAAAPERRSWFRRDRRAGADLPPAGAAAGTAGAFPTAGEGKYGAYPDRDVEAGHDPALGATPGAHLGGSPTGASTYGSGAPGYNGTTGAATAPAYGATGTGGYGGTDAPAPAAVPGEKRRGGFLSLVGMGKKNTATAPGPATGMGTGAPSAPPPPAAGTYEQPPGGAASAWTTAGHGLSGAPAT